MTSWFGFHSTNLNAPVPMGCLPNSVPHFSTALGLAMSKTNIARFARKGACRALSVIRTGCEPTAPALPDDGLAVEAAELGLPVLEGLAGLDLVLVLGVGGLPPPLEVPHHRGSVQRVAVVELHVLPEVERPEIGRA